MIKNILEEASQNISRKQMNYCSEQGSRPSGEIRVP